MKEEPRAFLSLLRHLPARLTVQQTAWVLNCQPHDIPALVAARLLKLLGNPLPNSIKFFAAADILESAQDRPWRTKVTATINLTGKIKNRLKRSRCSNAAHSDPPFSADAVRHPEPTL